MLKGVFVTLDLLCSSHESNFASKAWNITLEIPHLGEMSVKILETIAKFLLAGPLT
jgi:hypothetical protein